MAARPRMALLAGGAALVYFLGARLGYALAFKHSVVTLWPPAGIMLGLLVVSSRGDWPALVAGAVAGSMLSDRLSGYSPGLAAMAAIANATESVVAAWVVGKRLGRPAHLSKLANVLYFMFGAAVASNALTACVGTLVLRVGFDAAIPHAWFIWWAGDGVGMLVIAPAIIEWSRVCRTRGIWRRINWYEAAALFIVLVVSAEWSLGPPLPGLLQPGAFIVYPLLFWAAVRFGSAGAATAVTITAAIATWNASLGVGPLAGPDMSPLAVAIHNYTFLAISYGAAMIPAAIFSERARTERRLAESEARYRAVIQAATDAIVVVDDSGSIRFANAAVERIFGYSSIDLLGRSFDTLAPGGGLDVPAEIPTEAHARDGTAIPVDVSSGEAIINGRRVVTYFIRDVRDKQAARAALEAAEDEMRFAMSAARVGTWEVDIRSGRARWSEELQRLHGMQPGTFDETFEAFMAAIHPEDRKAVAAEIARSMRHGDNSRIQYRAVWPDGSVHWLSGTGRTFYDDSGTPIRAAGVGLDVTEQRALEDQYRQAQKMEAIGQLAGGIAHDFNNLLTVILSYASMLASELDPARPERDDIEEIRLAAERAASLTRQLLAFSRKQVLTPRIVDPADMLRSMEPMLRRLIGEDVEIVLQIAPDVGTIRADLGQIEQVIMNLVVNARDAMPDGGLLRLGLSEISAADGGDTSEARSVAIDVQDSGIGMDAATMARVFEPFFTTKPLGKGTGLGLSTVYGIVQQSGGRVLIDSEPGLGTSVRVLLPVADSSVETPTPVRSRLERGQGETILVVEDDEALRRLTVRLLSVSGYVTLEAGSPAEALAVATTHPGPIDLLLSDVVLPETSGPAVAEQLILRRPNVRVLFMSGHESDVIAQKGLLDHDASFLEKPFAPDVLRRRLRELLDPAPARVARPA